MRSEGNGVESTGDWITADAVKCGPRTNVRAAARFSAEELNAKEETIPSNNRWGNQ